MKRIQPIMSVLLVLAGSLSWGLAGTEEEIIRLQNDVLQLQNQIRLLQKSVDDTTAILRSLLEQLNDQMATSNVQMASVGRSFRLKGPLGILLWTRCAKRSRV